ncbi:BZ3500_MvSof-1268-A1-R1_Chr1-3g02265 [Microbotryum saponariae]|uniref:BZ3500_MvSof-1268-A1-R1_Chr1-3g02265 protein n=1 Tax=Microbotryum saponariae TaxID=289078 RepID=A0A2X0KPQ4_9BASI|nr:BZ3500_MvSof-1268-A1-R1_Chr1-3g02265 [Microbotryum saponariae]SCZ95822.1 BZ3501_MvSof-1269-A2-R1_Chr1-3g01868 [Microbotryum saponariae]
MSHSSADPPAPAGSAVVMIPRLPPPQFEPRAEGQPRLSLFTGTTGEFEALNRAFKRPRHVQSEPAPSPSLETAGVDSNRGCAATVDQQQTSATAPSESAGAKRPRLSLSTPSQTSCTPIVRQLTPGGQDQSAQPLRFQGAALVNEVLTRIVLFRPGNTERRARWGGDPRFWDEYSAIECALVTFTDDKAAHAVFSPTLLAEFKKTLMGQMTLAQAMPFSWQQFETAMKRVQSLINHLRALYCSTCLCQALPLVVESQWIDIVRAPSNPHSKNPQNSPPPTHDSPPLPSTAHSTTSRARPESSPGNQDCSRFRLSPPTSSLLDTEQPSTSAVSSPTHSLGHNLPAIAPSSVILPPRHRSRLGIPGSAASQGPSPPPTSTTSQSSKQGLNSNPSLGVSSGIVYGTSASWDASPFLSNSAREHPTKGSPLNRSPPRFQSQFGPSPTPLPPRISHIQESSHWSQPRQIPQSRPGPVHPHPQGLLTTHRSPPLGGSAGPFPPQQPQMPIEAELERIYQMGISAGRRYEHEKVHGKERARAEAETPSQASAPPRLSQDFAQALAQPQASMQATEKTQSLAKVQMQASIRAPVPQVAPPPNGSGHGQMQSPAPIYVAYRGRLPQTPGPNMPQMVNSRPMHYSADFSPTLPHDQLVGVPDRVPSPTEQFRASLHRPPAFIEGTEGLPEHFGPVYVLLNLATTPDVAKDVLGFLLDTLPISTALDVIVTRLRESARRFITRPPKDHHQLLMRVVPFYNAFAKHTAEQLKLGRMSLQAFNEGTLRVDRTEQAKIMGGFEQAKYADRVCEILARAIDTWHAHVTKILGPTPVPAPPRSRSQSGEGQGVQLLQNGQAGVMPSISHPTRLSSSLGTLSVRPAGNDTGAPLDRAIKPTHRASRSESNVAVPQNPPPSNNAGAAPRRVSGPSPVPAETNFAVAPQSRPSSRLSPPPQPVQPPPTARDRLRAKRDKLVPALEKVMQAVESFQTQSSAHEDYAALVQRFEKAKIERERQKSAASAASASPTS